MEMSNELDPTTHTAESELLSLAEGQEALAASLTGRYSAAQVYFLGPPEWVRPTAVVRLYGFWGGGRVLLSEVPLARSIHSQEDGQTTALVLAVRGVQVEGFEVVLAVRGGSPVSNGRIFLIASSRAEAVDLRPGLPAALQPLLAQGAPGSQANRWPVFLTDGSQAVGTPEAPLHVRTSEPRAAYCASAIVGSGTKPASTAKSILYVWNHGRGRRAEIRRVVVAYQGGSGKSSVTVRGTRITSQPSRAGGSCATPLSFDPTDAPSALSGVAAGRAPTRVPADLILFAVPVSSTGTFVWTWTDVGKPIVLPADVEQGFEIRTELSGAASTEMKLHVTIEWLET